MRNTFHFCCQMKTCFHSSIWTQLPVASVYTGKCRQSNWHVWCHKASQNVRKANTSTITSPLTECKAAKFAEKQPKHFSLATISGVFCFSAQNITEMRWRANGCFFHSFLLFFSLLSSRDFNWPAVRVCSIIATNYYYQHYHWRAVPLGPRHWHLFCKYD